MKCWRGWGLLIRDAGGLLGGMEGGETLVIGWWCFKFLAL